MTKRKSAIPEYIWYISLIVIAIVLVTTVVSLTNKAKKNNVNLPEIRDAQLVIYKTPLGDLKLADIEVLGLKKDDLNNLYLYCNGHYVDINQIVNTTIGFSKTPNNYLSLNNEVNLNLTALGFNESCGEEGAKWSLFYGNPEENGIKITETEVEFKSRW
jgi:ABC-type antimicrobial peptide transport system permease subunit